MHSFEMSDILSAITIITLLAVVVGDRVLGWLKTRGVDLSKLSEIYELTYNIQEQTAELMKRFDDSKLEDAIVSLAKNIAMQTKLLGDIHNQNELNRQEHKLILDQMERINKR